MPAFYASITDEKLLAMIKTADKDAFAEIYNRYWPILYRHALKMLKNHDESEDVVQDVFVKLWKIANQLDENISIGAYLYAATRNGILNIFSRSMVKDNYLAEIRSFMKEGYEIADHRVRENILAHLIESEIKKLPSRMREVFELKRKHNLSYKEIAEKMDISELTVKTQMNKAISTLRTKFGNHLGIFIAFL
jgi:RNA polymerase sigma-70 factor (ECF subfamily)